MGKFIDKALKTFGVLVFIGINILWLPGILLGMAIWIPLLLGVLWIIELKEKYDKRN